MAEVVLKGVSKIFSGGARAVSDVSLAIGDGEFAVLVGPSGCGKSTILRIIAGLEDATHGEVWIGGRLVNDVPPKGRDIAMVFQNYALYPHMTVFDNMAFGLRQQRIPRPEIAKRVNEAADILAIGPMLKRRPKELSGGERQRVAVGRAIVRKPKVFLFDEPLSNLDAKLRVGMRTELTKLHQRVGATMIYVTHDQVEAMTMGDRIAVLKGGVIQQVADPLTLYDRPANLFVSGFIGTPPMNFLRGTIASGATGLLFDGGAFRLPIWGATASALDGRAGRDVVLGIRPEDIACCVEDETVEGVMRVNVEVVEPMGSETWIYLSIGGHSFIARAAARTIPRVGSQIVVRPDMERAHFFDPQTEAALA